MGDGELGLGREAFSGVECSNNDDNGSIARSSSCGCSVVVVVRRRSRLFHSLLTRTGLVAEEAEFMVPVSGGCPVLRCYVIGTIPTYVCWSLVVGRWSAAGTDGQRPWIRDLDPCSSNRRN